MELRLYGGPALPDYPGMDSGGATSTPVLIAGGGPAGLAAAAELEPARHRLRRDRAAHEVSHRRPRAKTTTVRTMEHLRRWGIAARLRAAAPLPVAWSQRVTFCESLTGRRITDFDGAFGLTTGGATTSPSPASRCRSRWSRTCCGRTCGRGPASGSGSAESVTALAPDDAGVTVTIEPLDEAGYQLRARYVLGCDGAGGVVREQIGARYTGRSDPRPNFNVVFRAPGLDPPLGPAVHYWVVGGPVTGLMGRLDLAGTWWASFPGIDAAYGTAHATELITGLIGQPGQPSCSRPIRGPPGCSSPTSSRPGGSSWWGRPRT